MKAQPLILRHITLPEWRFLHERLDFEHDTKAVGCVCYLSLVSQAW
jgi:hypothetical protein